MDEPNYTAGSIYWGFSIAYAVRRNGPAAIHLAGQVYFSEREHSDWNRTQGPAIVYALGKLEYRSMKGKHRTTGPAVIHADGRKEYWINGTRVSQLEFFATHGVM